jgi:hypothetical protein
MSRILTFLLFLGSMVNSCNAQNYLSLAQFKRMPGVEVFCKDDPDSGSTRVTVELLGNADFLGTRFKDLGPYTLTAYLIVWDLDGHQIIKAPLHIERINSGESRSKTVKSNYSSIEFEIENKLLAKVQLDFHVQPMRGGFDTYICWP